MSKHVFENVLLFLKIVTCLLLSRPFHSNLIINTNVAITSLHLYISTFLFVFHLTIKNISKDRVHPDMRLVISKFKGMP